MLFRKFFVRARKILVFLRDSIPCRYKYLLKLRKHLFRREKNEKLPALQKTLQIYFSPCQRATRYLKMKKKKKRYFSFSEYKVNNVSFAGLSNDKFTEKYIMLSHLNITCNSTIEEQISIASFYS